MLLAGQKFPVVEQQVLITLCKVGTAWRMLKNFPLKLFMHPSIFEQPTPFPYILFVCTFPVPINNLPVNFHQMNILVFVNHNTGLKGFSVFMFIF